MTERALTVHVNGSEAVSALTAREVELAVVATVEAEEIEVGEFSITFIDGPAIAALHEQHLQIPGATDVIAFSLGEPDLPLGDVYICPEVAEESAREYGVALREELLRLVVHGVLHVLGHDHPQGPERADCEMFRLQEEILARLA